MKISRLFLVAIMLMLFADFALAKKGKSTKDSPKGADSAQVESKGESDTEQTSTLWSVSADEKSGGFFGFEVGLGGAKTSLVDYSKNLIVPQTNLIFGYQWYFLDVPWAHLGLRFSGHIGYSPYSHNKYFKSKYVEQSIFAHGVQYGADLGLMWDFVDSAKHTFGIYVAPLGFEGSTLFGKYTSSPTVDTIIISQGKAESITYKLATHTKFAYALSAGFQLMHKHRHLIFFTYRLRLYNGKLPKDEYKYENGSPIDYSHIGFSIQPIHSGIFGYAYKF